MGRENIFFKDWWVNHDPNKDKKRGTEDLKIKIEKKRRTEKRQEEQIWLKLQNGRFYSTYIYIYIYIYAHTHISIIGVNINGPKNTGIKSMSW